MGRTIEFPADNVSIGDDPANVCVLGPCPYETARGGYG